MGTWGRIRRERVGPRSYRARCRFRDEDGATRSVEAWGHSGAVAERSLLAKLRDRAAPSHGDLTPETRISRLADLWLEEITAEGRIEPQTVANYEGIIRTTIVPGLGELRAREATVSRLARFFRNLAASQPGNARLARTVSGQMLGMAVRHGALPSNPVEHIGRLPTGPANPSADPPDDDGSGTVVRRRKRRRPNRALKVSDLDGVRSAIRRWQHPSKPRPGPRPTRDLADIVDVLLATGVRIGEVLALRRIDLDLDSTPARATISGTIVYLKGRGYLRQAWPKTDAGYRTLALPQFAVEVLRQRLTSPSRPHDPMFPSRRGTWLSPANVRRQWRQARQATGYEWVTPKTFRKTVATLLDREADNKTAAAQLGHSNEDITDTYYIEKPHEAPDVSHILQQLGSAPKRPLSRGQGSIPGSLGRMGDDDHLERVELQAVPARHQRG